jgi:hypothetical protein
MHQSTQDTRRQQIGRYGALKSWANTADRTARTSAARSKGPSSLEYHLDRLPADVFATASPEARTAAAEAARRAYFAGLALKSAANRRRAPKQAPKVVATS